jgi:hypothetical protein
MISFRLDFEAAQEISVSREVCIVIGHAEIMLMQEPAWKLNFPNTRGAESSAACIDVVILL